MQRGKQGSRSRVGGCDGHAHWRDPRSSNNAANRRFAGAVATDDAAARGSNRARPISARCSGATEGGAERAGETTRPLAPARGRPWHSGMARMRQGSGASYLQRPGQESLALSRSVRYRARAARSSPVVPCSSSTSAPRDRWRDDRSRPARGALPDLRARRGRGSDRRARQVPLASFSTPATSGSARR